MTVDLGCGPHKRADIGLDCVPGPGVDVVCWAGFEPLPFADASVQGFVAYDFLEHLPVAVWERVVDRTGPEAERVTVRVHRPRIYLLREIYRCLVPGGVFESVTPVEYPEWAQDPTHEAPPWTEATWDYFCGGRPEVPTAHYGIDVRFQLLLRERVGPQGHHLRVIVRKPTSIETP
jgi:SAM-dependent methyltransferase